MYTYHLYCHTHKIVESLGNWPFQYSDHSYLQLQAGIPLSYRTITFPGVGASVPGDRHSTMSLHWQCICS